MRSRPGMPEASSSTAATVRRSKPYDRRSKVACGDICYLHIDTEPHYRGVGNEPFWVCVLVLLDATIGASLSRPPLIPLRGPADRLFSCPVALVLRDGVSYVQNREQRGPAYIRDR